MRLFSDMFVKIVIMIGNNDFYEHMWYELKLERRTFAPFLYVPCLVAEVAGGAS